MHPDIEDDAALPHDCRTTAHIAGCLAIIMVVIAVAIKTKQCVQQQCATVLNGAPRGDLGRLIWGGSGAPQHGGPVRSSAPGTL